MRASCTLLLAIALSLGGCKKKAAPPPEPLEPVPTEQVELPPVPGAEVVPLHVVHVSAADLFGTDAGVDAGVASADAGVDAGPADAGDDEPGEPFDAGPHSCIRDG